MNEKPATDLCPTSAEPDRTWFKQRPARSHRLRTPDPNDMKLHGRKTFTHVIVARQPKNRLARTPIDLSGHDRQYLRTIINFADVASDLLLYRELAGLVREASSSFR